MNLHLHQTRAMTRRHFFGGVGLSLGSIALSSMLAKEARAAR